MLVAIDPGPEQSGWVTIGGAKIEAKVVPNDLALLYVRHLSQDFQVVIEMIEPRGKSVGYETFETCVWIGKFENEAQARFLPVTRIFRRDVKRYHCGSVVATDANVWQSIVDEHGGNRATAIGTKRNPGPLYGVQSHCRQALALGLAFLAGVRSERLEQKTA